MSLNLIRGLEERSLNAWPSLKTTIHNGYIIRSSPGHPSKRASSATALYTTDDGTDDLELLEEVMRPCVIRQTPLTSNRLVGRCLERGYRSIDTQVVMLCPLTEALPMKPQHPVRGSSFASHPWLKGFDEASSSSEAASRAHAQMLESIMHPALFVQAGDDTPVAFGYGVMERGMVGVFDVVTNPKHRRKGLAKSILVELLRWGVENRAKQAYLQVGAANETALRLYRDLGFKEVYRYSYLVSQEHYLTS